MAKAAPFYANTYEEMQQRDVLLARARKGNPAVDPGYARAVADVIAWVAGSTPAPALSALLKLEV